MGIGYLVGIDLGGTKLTIVVADGTGAIIARRESPLSHERGEISAWHDGIASYGPASQIEDTLRELLGDVGVSKIDGIGIGSAGPLQYGAIRNPPNISIDIPENVTESVLYIPLVDPLRHAFSVPVTLENDCNTAVLGEVFFGAGKDIVDKNDLHLVYVTMSTGLGAGVWSGGHLLLGKDGNAAEIGHIVVKEDGIRCGCGNVGCAEAYCSGNGIVKNARLHLLDDGLSMQSPLLQLASQQTDENTPRASDSPGASWRILDSITPSLVFKAAAAGDEVARNVISDFTHYGGIVLSAIANAYDPSLITLGGSIAVNHPEIVAPMYEEMCTHLNVAPPEVILTPLERNAVEYGAIVLARQH